MSEQRSEKPRFKRREAVIRKDRMGLFNATINGVPHVILCDTRAQARGAINHLKKGLRP